MALLARVLTTWSGGPGGSGLTVMNCRYTTGSLTNTYAAVRAFWNTVQADMPTGYTSQVLGSSDIHDPANDALVSVATGTQPASVSGASTGAYAAGVGSQVKWLTGAIHGGHRVQGRTFIVPLLGTKYDTDGTLTSTTMGVVNGAAATLLTALTTAGTPLVIYSKQTGTVPVGEISDVTSGSVVDRVATLRTRRR